MNTLFKDKNILITGGTGSIGSEILKHLLPHNPKRIVIFSRDEYKQHALKYKYNNNANIEYVIGDIKDLESLMYVSQGMDVIFHAAALKHVPISEESPEEFIKTNIGGSINVKKAALTNKIPLVVSISTDKAVDPLNVMGMTKALQEKIFSSFSLQKRNHTIRFVNVRFGNVIGTKGSLFPILYHQIKNNLPITLTHLDMTRFFMTKADAIQLVFWAAEHGKNGDTIIKKMKSIKIKDLIRLFLQVTKQPKNYPVKEIGIRVGEKMHEYLITADEIFRTKQNKEFLIISPYTPNALQANLILDKKTASLEDLNDFFSNNPACFFEDKEVVGMITEFIKEIDANMQII